MADQLRFPIFLQAITAVGAEDMRKAAAKLPRRTRDLVARYEAQLDQAVLDDLRYDYRIRLVPMVGPKTDADLAINFVKLDELNEDERKVMTEAGRTGTVIVRDRQVEVATKNKLLPKHVAQMIQEQVPFHFTVANNTEMWKRLQVRPSAGANDPYQTEARYCVYDEPCRSYLYTAAWVKRILKEIGTVEKYRWVAGGNFTRRLPQSEVGRRRGARGSGPFPSAPSRTVRAPFDAYRSPVFISG